MAFGDRFKCPSCGGFVFNRRNVKCEFCSADLPSEMSFTPEQLAVLAAEHARNDAMRERLDKAAKERERLRVKKKGDVFWEAGEGGGE